MFKIGQYFFCLIVIAIASIAKKGIKKDRYWEPEDFLIGYEATIGTITILCLLAANTFNSFISDVQKIPFSMTYLMQLSKMPFISYFARIVFITSILTNQKIVFDGMKEYYFKWSRWQVVSGINLFSCILFFFTLVSFIPLYNGTWLAVYPIGLFLAMFAFSGKLHVGIIAQTIAVILTRLFLSFEYQTLFFILLTFTNFSTILEFFDKRETRLRAIRETLD